MSNRSNLDSQSPSRSQQKAQLCELFFEMRSKLDEVIEQFQRQQELNLEISCRWIQQGFESEDLTNHQIQHSAKFAIASAVYLRRVIPLDEDQNTIFNTDYAIILQFLKTIITHLITSKDELEQIIEQKNQNECSDYETCLQKLEAEVRNHIRNEQQLKLYAETTQEKLEQVMKEKQDIEEKYKGLNVDQFKQIEKAHNQVVEQLKRKEDEYLQVQMQFKQKAELAEQQEETIQQLKGQIQRMQQQQQQSQQQNHLSNSQWLLQQQSSQTQFNPQLNSGDSSQSSKMVSVNPNQLSSQQNLNELSYIEAKRGKRSVSSMNEDTIKKYTQFSQSSQINPQQILSSSSQISYNTQNKNQISAQNSEQAIEQQATRMYTDPHVQERSSSRLGNVGEMKENRKSFDKYASSIQEKLMKKDGSTNNNYYYNENNNNSSLSINNTKNPHLQQQQANSNNLLNSKVSVNPTLVTVSQNSRQTSGQLGIQKQAPLQSTMPYVGSAANNASSLANNSKQKPTTQQSGIQPTSQQNYLQSSGIQYNSSLSSTSNPPVQMATGLSTQQQGYVSGSRIKYGNHQQNSSLTGGIGQNGTLNQTNSINGSSGATQHQHEGSYQTLDSQRNKQALANKLNEIQNCLSSRQPNNLGFGQGQQSGQTQPIQQGTHLRNSSNHSILNTNEKQNIGNTSYALQHYNQQQQHNSQQMNAGSASNISQLNSSSIKYSPATHQVSYSNTQQIQQTGDLNKSSRSFMNASMNNNANNNNNNNNLSMNQYNSKEQNNMNSSATNGTNNNSIGHLNSNFKQNSQLNSQVNSNHLHGNTKYGQYIQSQRPNSSFEKQNPYIQNTQSHYKPQQQGVINMPAASQNIGVQNNNGQLSYQVHHNPRSQSMDGFQKQQQQQPTNTNNNNNNKPNNTHQVQQNAYLKQKTTSQMQAADAINIMIKNFKMN